MKNITRFFTNPSTNELTQKKVGLLFLSSGKIVACDPLTILGEEHPFTKTVQPGKYPVNIYYHDIVNGVPYAELKISEEPVVKWEMAVKEMQDITTLQEDEFFGYPVDAGFGCFMDVETSKLLEKHEQKLQRELGDKYNNYYDNYFVDLLKGGKEDCFIAQPYPEVENNFAAFMSGYGDGVYATYIGLDKNNYPAKFVTEFVV